MYLNRVPGAIDPGNHLDGNPLLPVGTGLPRCRKCGRELSLFFQFALPVELGLPFIPGSRLSVFMCQEPNEIPSFEQRAQLSEGYWDRAEGHWFCLLAVPGEERVVVGPDILEHQALVWSAVPQDANYCISVAGQPIWMQEPERFMCSCGSPMRFVCQVSDSYKFEPTATAPEQPDSSHRRGYILFLGNETYVFACLRQCNPRAVWITVQN